jgi:hypothetical protein
MIDHVCNTEATLTKNNEKERLILICNIVKKTGFYVSQLWQQFCFFFLCLHWKLVTHTRTIGRACKSLRVLLYQMFDMMGKKAKDTG